MKVSRTPGTAEIRSGFSDLIDARDELRNAQSKWHTQRNHMIEVAINANMFDCFDLNLTKLARRVRELTDSNSVGIE